MLEGRRILVTRAAEQAAGLAEELARRGAKVVVVPLLAFADPPSWEPADEALGSLGRYTAILFTSANAVRRFWDRMQARVGSCDVPALPAGPIVLAVGPKTAAELGARGVSVAAVPGEHRGRELAVELAKRVPLAGARVLLPRALVADEALPRALREAGVAVDVVPVYRTVVPGGAREALASAFAKGLDAVTLTSASAAEHLVELLPDRRALDGIVLVAIGPSTAERALAVGLPAPSVAARATGEALAEALERALR
jgi:uroporphyrinogen-III synthase